MSNIQKFVFSANSWVICWGKHGIFVRFFFWNWVFIHSCSFFRKNHLFLNIVNNGTIISENGVGIPNSNLREMVTAVWWFFFHQLFSIFFFFSLLTFHFQSSTVIFMCYNFYVSQSMLNYDQKKDIINPKRCQSSVFKDWSRKILLSFPPTLGWWC
mgnify:CR=1 FL=1